MAVSIHSSTATFFFHTTPSISPPPLSSTKVFVGLKPQNSSLFSSAIPNLTAGFHDRVFKSLHWRYDSKRTRGRVNMMPIGTPLVRSNSPNNVLGGGIDVQNALYRKRIISIGSYIDEAFGNQILATMLYLDCIEYSKRLNLFISSGGGDLTPSMAIYDTMQSLRSPVGTLGLGCVNNMAAFILAAGDKGHRSAMPLLHIVLQSPAGAARGQADDTCYEANELLRIKEYLVQELAKNTGQTVEKIDEDIRQTKLLSAKEAVKYGLIDRIARPAPIMDMDADAPRKDLTAGLG